MLKCQFAKLGVVVGDVKPGVLAVLLECRCAAFEFTLRHFTQDKIEYSFRVHVFTYALKSASSPFEEQELSWPTPPRLGGIQANQFRHFIRDGNLSAVQRIAAVLQYPRLRLVAHLHRKRP